MDISSIKDQNTVSILAFLISLIIFVPIGYSIGGLIGIFLGLAITLILSTYLKYFLIRAATKEMKSKKVIKKEYREPAIEDIKISSDEKEGPSEVDKKDDIDDGFDFEDGTPIMKGGSAESQGYSIESGSGAGKLQLRKSKIVSKQRIRSSRAIFYNTSIEEIKRMTSKELLELIKNGKETDRKLEFLETVIWELNNLETYDKFSSLIRIAEKLHIAGMRSGARSLYRNLEITCKNVEGIETKSRLFKDLALLFSNIGNMKKSVKYLREGFDLCCNIDDIKIKSDILTEYIQVARNNNLPKLTNFIVNHALNIIKEKGSYSRSIKIGMMSDLLDILVETDGTRLEKHTIRDMNETLNSLELDDRDLLHGKLMIITAKEGYQDLYEYLIKEYGGIHRNLNELFYEIPYEKLGKNIFLNKRYQNAIEYRNYVPSEYEENYNQGLIRGMIERGDLKDAFQNIQKMDLLDDKGLLSDIVKRVAKLGDLNQSQRIAKKHKLTGTAVTISLELVDDGHIQAAEDLIEELNPEEKYKIDTEIGLELGRQGKFIKARHRFESAEQQISGLQNTKKMIDGYLKLAKNMNITLKENNSIEVLKKAMYRAEEIEDISKIFGAIVTCGHEKEALENALNIRDERDSSKILERVAIDIILSVKEVPKDILNLIKTVENKKYDLNRDRDIFENIAISLLEEKDHIDQMFRIGDIYRKFKDEEKKGSVTDNRKLEIIASWAKTKREKIEDQE